MSLDAATLSRLAEDLGQLLGDADCVLNSDDILQSRSFDCWPVAAKTRQQGHLTHKPDLVVMARNATDVGHVLSYANERKIPVTTRGLGSSVVGGPLATRGGIVLDTSHMTRVININRTDMLVTVEAGKNGGELEDELAKQGLSLCNSPQSLYRSTVGGWVATRETGQFSSKFGGIEELVTGFKAISANGRTHQFGPHARMAVGPDLRHLVIGSEGCLFVVTEVTLKCFPKAETQLFQTATFSDLHAGVACMRDIMQARLRPSLLRFYDLAEARHAMKDTTFPLPVMFLGTEGVEAVAKAEMTAIETLCQRHGGQLVGPDGTSKWMARRFDFSGVENLLARPDGIAETIEVSNHWSTIGRTYDLLTKRLAPFADEVLGHFSHAYTDGISLYVILLGNAANAADGERKLRELWAIANATALETGATLSHHHGSGLARSASVPAALGSTWPILQAVKQTFDPNHILNPGKLGFK
jgi:alkyldihydroxyacetonephosphate synthase